MLEFSEHFRGVKGSWCQVITGLMNLKGELLRFTKS